MDYPYYIVPDIERYRRLDPGSKEGKRLAAKIAINIGDYAALRLVLGIDPPEFAGFYPDMNPSTPSSLDTIDSFLEKYAPKSKATGYMAEYETRNPVTETETLLETAEVPTEAIKEEIPQPETAENFDEAFRKLLKEKKLQEALQLIERQNLNNSPKSIYFAHQIRFLRKLIAIEKHKNKKG